jgi:hypothetical protein
MNPLIQTKNATILPVLIALTLGCFGLSPQARAVCQEGCLTGNNTVLGEDALLNTTGTSNAAIGVQALASNTTGSNNTATGLQALTSNTTGIDNTATGLNALASNTDGGDNTANGLAALGGNSTGEGNTATGVVALASNTTGSNNIALGFAAGILLTTGDNNIHIGNPGVADESNRIRISTQRVQRATFIAGISGEAAAGSQVIVSPSGRLGVIASSKRFKDDIKPMDKASEAILALKPVTFRYKHELDPDGIPQFGLVAEQVEKVNSDLVARDDEGKPYTVRYEAVNAMLLNEFLKEHRKVADQSDQIAELKTTVAELKVALKAQAAQIQKVSDQLRAQVFAPRVVAND